MARLVVLGIDPGLASLGWAVLHVDGALVSLADCGTLHTKPKTKAGRKVPDDHRVYYLASEVMGLLALHQPLIVGVEAHVWMGKERSVNEEAFRVSRVSGICEGLAMACGHGATVARVTRNQALRSVGASTESAGDATIRRLLRFPEVSSQHARDAAMVAWAARKMGTV